MPINGSESLSLGRWNDMITHHLPRVGRKLSMSTSSNRGFDIDSPELSVLFCLIDLGFIAKSMIMIYHLIPYLKIYDI